MVLVVRLGPRSAETVGSQPLWMGNRGLSDGAHRLHTFLLRFLLAHESTRVWVCSRSGLLASASG